MNFLSDCTIINRLACWRLAFAAIVGAVSGATAPRFRTRDLNDKVNENEDDYSYVAVASPRRSGSGMFKLDYGTFYASKTFSFHSDGGSSGRQERRIIWAWSDETDVCRPWPACERVWPKPPKDLHRRWRGLQTLPRDIQWDAKEGVVLTRPVPELSRLRLPHYRNRPATAEIELRHDSHRVEQAILGLAASSAEFRATFDVGSIANAGITACEFLFGIRLYHTDSSSSDGTRGYTDVVYRLDVAAQSSLSSSPAPSLGLWVLRNHTGGATSDHGDNQPQGGPVIISPSSIQAGSNTEWQSLSLTIFSDLSIIEAFAQDGREAVTSRIYPATKLLKATNSLAPWSAALFAESTPLQPGGCASVGPGGALVRGAVEAYELGSCWVDTPELLPA